MKVYSNLDKFDPNWGEENDPYRKFHRWIYVISRNVLNMELRKIYKSKMSSLPVANISSGESLSDTNRDFSDLIPTFKQKLAELLTEGQLAVVLLKMQGKSELDISEELGISIGAIRQRTLPARKKIECHLIYSVGFKRVSSFRDNSLVAAASAGRLEAVNFLGRWYTKDDWVSRYEPRRMVVDNSLLEEGYVLLSKGATPAEYRTLKGSRYLDLLRRRRGRLYIKTVDLEKFRNHNTERGEAGKNSLRPLADFAETSGLYESYRRAAKKGTLKAERKSLFWFTDQASIDEYLSSNGPNV